jgi:hypothetical protein
MDLGKLNDLIERYNRRSNKIGVKPLVFIVEKKTNKLNKLYFEVSFEGDPAKINGWEFLGTIQHTNNGNLLRAIPGKELPAQYRDIKPHCEHCNEKRTLRETFVLMQDMTYKQVGRNCLRDFLGHDPAIALALLNVLNEVRDSVKLGEGPLLAPCQDVIEMNAAVALHVGFSKDAPGLAWNYLFPGKDFIESIRKGRHPDIRVTDDARELAQKAISWINTKQDLNNFLHNVLVASKIPLIGYKENKLCGWVIGAYLKEVEKEKMAQTQAQIRREKYLADKALSKHVGIIGQRMDLQLKLKSKILFGDLTLYKFITPENEIITWLTTPKSLEEYPIATEFVSCKATIKQHREYKEVAETAVTRIKFK